jgi:hypothetical protein
MENPLVLNKAFDRKGVLVLGKPINQSPFLERQLSVMEFGNEFEKGRKKMNEFINHSRAIIISPYPSEFKLIRKSFEKLFSDADNLSVLQFVLYDTEDDGERIRKIRDEKAPDNPLNKVYGYNQLTEIAEIIARHQCGPSPTELIIDPSDILKEINNSEIELLLRRSFFDCERIYLEQIKGGRDSNYLLKVHAWIRDSHVGCPLPLPFFAKIASKKKISRELKNYADYTEMYISFQFRPNYRPERCISTRNFSALIGNFVDDSISLRTALEDSYNTGIIFSLFERSMHSLRLQSSVQKRMPSKGELTSFMEGVIGIDDLLKNEDVISKARDLGLKTDVKKIYEKLLVNCPLPILMGTIHGDLHSGNVMVRGNDAILIDFSAIRMGPLTADPITLEVSLSFNLGESQAPEFRKWKSFVDSAYNPDALAKPLAFTESVPNEFFWLRRSIREIRHILAGCDCSSDEVKVIMASYLMRIARLTPNARKSRKEQFEFKCHSYALVLAEGIVDSLVVEKR